MHGIAAVEASGRGEGHLLGDARRPTRPTLGGDGKRSGDGSLPARKPLELSDALHLCPNRSRGAGVAAVRSGSGPARLDLRRCVHGGRPQLSDEADRPRGGVAIPGKPVTLRATAACRRGVNNMNTRTIAIAALVIAVIVLLILVL